MISQAWEIRRKLNIFWIQWLSSAWWLTRVRTDVRQRTDTRGKRWRDDDSDDTCLSVQWMGTSTPSLPMEWMRLQQTFGTTPTGRWWRSFWRWAGGMCRAWHSGLVDMHCYKILRKIPPPWPEGAGLISQGSGKLLSYMCGEFATSGIDSRSFPAFFLPSGIFQRIYLWKIFNPILHTAWLNNHALALKRNTAKYFFGEKYSFLHTFLKICCESRKI